ncbi:MAG TPA: lysylphosphatidylglycerol synthase transmembrane domain-containing protein [Phnomibacter sp.]|nr:lysylphosphatidylglycerol synthase transmembrane domain-containing protein [Phnomibacter sp.]
MALALPKLPGWVKLLLKLLVTGGCLWYVGQKINWTSTWQLLLNARLGWLLLAALLFMASKWVSAIRLQFYFGNLGLRLSAPVNLVLYWLGMFYNLFLPGGIGGDAYKVILLNRHYPQHSLKKLGAAVLLDRISGVAGLGILAALFFGWLFKNTWYGLAAMAAIMPGVVLFKWIVGKWFASFVRSFWPTLWLGLAVQALQVLCVWAIMASIGLQQHFAAFQFLFLLSSIVAIFPFTIGGLGARELVFLWGAGQFALAQQEAVFISLLFYVITVAVSALGAVWVFKQPLPKHYNHTNFTT